MREIQPIRSFQIELSSHKKKIDMCACYKKSTLKRFPEKLFY